MKTLLSSYIGSSSDIYKSNKVATAAAAAAATLGVDMMERSVYLLDPPRSWKQVEAM
jgi:hypothetical protein